MNKLKNIRDNKDFYMCIKNTALENPDKILLQIDNNKLTYKKCMEETEQYAKGLKSLGIEKDDKVGIIMPNSLDWYIVYWSAIRIGAQPVAIDPQSGIYELERLIETTQLKCCFIASQYRSNKILSIMEEISARYIKPENVILMNSSEKICSSVFKSRQDFEKVCSEISIETEIYKPNENDIMSLACTSGTTGNPKILTVPYYGFYDAIYDMGEYLEFSENDVMMIGMTLYHQGGFGMGMQVVVNGGTVIYQPQFNPNEFLKTVEKNKVTIIQLTSTLAKVLLSAPDFYEHDFSSVKICYFAGEVLPRELAEIFVEKLGIRVINIIGSSETATMVVWDSDRDYEKDPSDFYELPFTKVKVLKQDGSDAAIGEVGELCIYTSAVILNYYKNPVESSKKVITIDGKRWFMTGDLVKRLDDTCIRFAGRSKRIIKRGGNLVYAEEVESALLTYPKIAAVAVVAKDHPVIGQQISAYVQTIDNQKITRGEIAKFFNGKLSSYKLPDEIIVTKELPKDIGKIQFKYIKKTGK